MALIPSKSGRVPYGVPNYSPFDTLWYKGGSLPSGGGGWTPPTDTYPTAFSPTARGGVGTEFGVYADGGMRVVRHDATTAWLSIRTISGIASGSRVSCWATVTGTSNAIGIGLGNSSVLLSNYAGADANGVTLFGDTADVYSGGASVEATTGTLAQNDRVRMDVNRVDNTVRFYLQSGGSGAYVALCDEVDISGLGSGILYPVCSTEDANCVVTWDFGHGSETAPSGFTAGPRGNWGWWNDPAIVAAMTETWLASDTTRMWELAASVGAGNPDVVNNDPLGGWYGILYARLLEQSTAGQRPTYTTAGVRFNATGGTKQMADALASTFNANTPFTVLLNFDLLSGRSIRAGLGTSATALNSGVSWATGGKEVVTTRATGTSLATADVRNDACIVLTYDGTKAYALDSDGTWSEVLVGPSTGTITHLILRAVTSEATDATVYAMQILSGAVNEDQAKNLQWSARNVL